MQKECQRAKLVDVLELALSHVLAADELLRRAPGRASAEQVEVILYAANDLLSTLTTHLFAKEE